VIVIAGRVAVHPDNVEAALPVAQTMMAETLKEPGCAAYKFSADLDAAGVFHIFEEWDSQEALDGHFASPHMAAFRSALGKFDVQELSVSRYDVAKKGPLSG
jgi:quinol monooxygenase YgiN